MKHAILIDASVYDPQKHIEVILTKERRIYLAEAEYTPEELEAYNEEAKQWILHYSGCCLFYAETDGGADYKLDISQYFDLTAQTAIFDDGKFVGFYVCDAGFDYTDYKINRWFFPNPFHNQWERSSSTHIVLFAEEETHRWNGYEEQWVLQKRNPNVNYHALPLS